MSDPTAALEWELWLDGLPGDCRDVLDRLNPGPTLPVCFRGSTDGGHYLLVSIFEAGPDHGPVLKVAHCADSFLPGVQVMGVDPADLRPCGCGTPAVASVEQLAGSAGALDDVKAAAQALAAAAGLAWGSLTPAERRAFLFPWGRRG